MCGAFLFGGKAQKILVEINQQGFFDVLKFKRKG